MKHVMAFLPPVVPAAIQIRALRAQLTLYPTMGDDAQIKGSKCVLEM